MSGFTLDSFKAASKVTRMRCSVAVVRAALEPGDQAALDVALADESITGKAIAAVLSDAGHPIHQGTVTRHRRGDCCCEEKT